MIVAYLLQDINWIANTYLIRMYRDVGLGWPRFTSESWVKSNIGELKTEVHTIHLWRLLLYAFNLKRDYFTVTRFIWISRFEINGQFPIGWSAWLKTVHGNLKAELNQCVCGSVPLRMTACPCLCISRCVLRKTSMQSLILLLRLSFVWLLLHDLSHCKYSLVNWKGLFFHTVSCCEWTDWSLLSMTWITGRISIFQNT